MQTGSCLSIIILLHHWVLQAVFELFESTATVLNWPWNPRLRIMRPGSMSPRPSFLKGDDIFVEIRHPLQSCIFLVLCFCCFFVWWYWNKFWTSWASIRKHFQLNIYEHSVFMCGINETWLQPDDTLTLICDLHLPAFSILNKPWHSGRGWRGTCLPFEIISTSA